MMGQTKVCATCSGAYLTPQKDGAAYIHGCPPLSEWEKKALTLSLADTVERNPGIQARIKAAITT